MTYTELTQREQTTTVKRSGGLDPRTPEISGVRLGIGSGDCLRAGATLAGCGFAADAFCLCREKRDPPGRPPFQATDQAGIPVSSPCPSTVPVLAAAEH
ncbi:MAG: hypothetical protein ABTQ25_02490 [Nitrosomonas ureae]